MAALKILVIPGSLRTGSLNAKLAAIATHHFAQAGVDVTRLSLADFTLPIYDGDLQTKSGVPKSAEMRSPARVFSQIAARKSVMLTCGTSASLTA